MTQGLHPDLSLDDPLPGVAALGGMGIGAFGGWVGQFSIRLAKAIWKDPPRGVAWLDLDAWGGLAFFLLCCLTALACIGIACLAVWLWLDSRGDRLSEDELNWRFTATKAEPSTPSASGTVSFENEGQVSISLPAGATDQLRIHEAAWVARPPKGQLEIKYVSTSKTILKNFLKVHGKGPMPARIKVWHDTEDRVVIIELASLRLWCS